MNGSTFRSAMIGGVAVLLALLLDVAPARAADEPLTVVSVDVAGAPQVRAVVAAPPALAGQVLGASAFSVNEQGSGRPVTVEALPADQLEVALVIDTSGSMSGAALTAAKGAASTLLNQLPATVPVSVVGFGATPILAAPRSTDRAAQLAAVAALQARGETALYDAVQTGIGQFGSDARARRSVVVLSDGGDTSSRATLDQTVAALTAAKVTVFAVELKTSESNAAPLAQMASATGGRSVAAADPGALGAVFDGIAKQLVRQYSLSWTTVATGPVDAEVVLTSGDVRAVARTRFDLPVAAVGTAAAARQPTPAEPATGGAAWGLFVGSLLVGLGLLVVLLLTVAFRTPRSRALSGGRWRSAERSFRGMTDRADDVLDRVLSEKGPGAWVNALLERSGLDLRPSEAVFGIGALAAAVAVVLTLARGVIAGVIGGLAVLALAGVVLSGLDRRRRQRFADQLGDTLQMLAGSLRAGYGLAQAIDVVAREAESPTAEEFRRVTVETRLGRDSTEAMRALAARVRSQDFEWVVESFEIHRDVGGDLAEVLDSVSGTIRDRNRVRRQVRALSAEGRLSAIVLFVLPLILAAVTAVLDPDYLHELTGSGTGIAMIATGSVLMAAGGLWLRRIVKPTF